MAATGLTVIAGCTGSAPPVDLYRWGSSSLGSSGYVIIEAFAQMARRHTPFRHASLATAGTAENMFLIGAGKLDFAHSTSVDWNLALTGSKPYSRPVKANQLFAYAIWHQLPVVRADSDIVDLTDLAGRRFSPSQPGSGTATMYNALLRAAGIHDKVRWRYGSWSEVYTAFRAGQIDSVVGMLTNGVRSSGVRQLETTLSLRAVQISPELLRRAHAVNAGIILGSLDGDDWAAVGRPMSVPAITGIVASSAAVSPETGYAVTRNILERSAELRNVGPALQLVDVDFAVRNLITAAPVNAGAAQYFMEQGVWRNDLTVAGR